MKLIARAHGPISWAQLQVSGWPALDFMAGVRGPSSWALLTSNLSGGAAFMVVGLNTQTLPLQPFGFGFGSNCSALVTTEGVRFLVQSAGAAAWNTQVPNDPSFAGVHLYAQVLEVGAVSAVSAGGDAEINF